MRYVKRDQAGDVVASFARPQPDAREALADSAPELGALRARREQHSDAAAARERAIDALLVQAGSAPDAPAEVREYLATLPRQGDAGA